MKMKLFLPVVMIATLTGYLSSCKKKQEVIKPDPPPKIDTLALLTAHRWYVDYIWSDNNNDGKKDYLSEIFPGAASVTVYSFHSNGTFSDSTSGHILPGTWYFKGATKDSIYITIDTIGNYLHSIQSITDSTMATKKWGSLEYWYFIKY